MATLQAPCSRQLRFLRKLPRRFRSATAYHNFDGSVSRKGAQAQNVIAGRLTLFLGA
jgi:hypothetical protein